MSDGTKPVGGGAFPPCILLKLLDLSKLLDGFLNVVTHMDLSKKLYGFVYVVTWICQSCVGIFITDCIQMTGITKSFLEIILRHQFRLEGSQQLGIWR